MEVSNFISFQIGPHKRHQKLFFPICCYEWKSDSTLKDKNFQFFPIGEELLIEGENSQELVYQSLIQVFQQLIEGKEEFHMSNLWNLHFQRETKTEQNCRALKIREDLQKSIEYFNKTNINSPKFGYSSVTLTWKKCGDTETSSQRSRNNFSQRSSVDDKVGRFINEQAKEQAQQGARKMKRENKKMTWAQFQQLNKQNAKESSKMSKTFSIRQIKGVVFKKKKASPKINSIKSQS